VRPNASVFSRYFGLLKPLPCVSKRKPIISPAVSQCQASPTWAGRRSEIPSLRFPGHRGETPLRQSERTHAFIREAVLPIEDKFGGDIAVAGGDMMPIELQSAAGNAGLLAPHGPVRFGGLGLSMRDRAGVFEAAG
jgi:hypothetical protein